MICNASPLIFLAKINQLFLLKKLFGRIYIPLSVKEEILIKDKPGFIAIERAIEECWIEIKGQKNKIELGLGKGEQDAINMAIEMKKQLIIDDAMGIKVARSFNV